MQAARLHGKTSHPNTISTSPTRMPDSIFVFVRLLGRRGLSLSIGINNHWIEWYWNRIEAKRVLHLVSQHMYHPIAYVCAQCASVLLMMEGTRSDDSWWARQVWEKTCSTPWKTMKQGWWEGLFLALTALGAEQPLLPHNHYHQVKINLRLASDSFKDSNIQIHSHSNYYTRRVLTLG